MGGHFNTQHDLCLHLAVILGLYTVLGICSTTFQNVPCIARAAAINEKYYNYKFTVAHPNILPMLPKIWTLLFANIQVQV